MFVILVYISDVLWHVYRKVWQLFVTPSNHHNIINWLHSWHFDMSRQEPFLLAAFSWTAPSQALNGTMPRPSNPQALGILFVCCSHVHALQTLQLQIAFFAKNYEKETLFPAYSPPLKPVLWRYFWNQTRCSSESWRRSRPQARQKGLLQLGPINPLTASRVPSLRSVILLRCRRSPSVTHMCTLALWAISRSPEYVYIDIYVCMYNTLVHKR